MPPVMFCTKGGSLRPRGGDQVSVAGSMIRAGRSVPVAPGLGGRAVGGQRCTVDPRERHATFLPAPRAPSIAPAVLRIQGVCIAELQKAGAARNDAAYTLLQAVQYAHEFLKNGDKFLAMASPAEHDEVRATLLAARVLHQMAVESHARLKQAEGKLPTLPQTHSKQLSASARDLADSAIRAARAATDLASVAAGAAVPEAAALAASRVDAAADAATSSGDPAAIAAAAAAAAAVGAVAAAASPAAAFLVANFANNAASAARAAAATLANPAAARAAFDAAVRTENAADGGTTRAALAAAVRAATAAVAAADHAAAVADRIRPLLQAIPSTPSREKDDFRSDICARIAIFANDEPHVHRAQSLIAKALVHTPASDRAHIQPRFNSQRALDVLATICMRMMYARPTIPTSLPEAPSLLTLAALRVQQSLDGSRSGKWPGIVSASEMHAISCLLHENLALWKTSVHISRMLPPQSLLTRTRTVNNLA